MCALRRCLQKCLLSVHANTIKRGVIDERAHWVFFDSSAPHFTCVLRNYYGKHSHTAA
jgi:hypothetical protein